MFEWKQVESRAMQARRLSETWYCDNAEDLCLNKHYTYEQMRVAMRRMRLCYRLDSLIDPRRLVQVHGRTEQAHPRNRKMRVIA